VAEERFRNLILQVLGDDAIEKLALRHAELEQGRSLQKPGARIREVFFIEDGMASMTIALEDGSHVEAGMFGWDSVIGGAGLMGVTESNCSIAMQVPGHGYISTLEAASAEFRMQSGFQRLVLRYAQSQVMQAAQASGCNARHNVQQRLSRWLLLCRDRTTSDVMPLTQEYLAMMLGVERPAVSVVAAKLQEQGAIEYSRGRVRVVDRARLESIACECYQAVRQEMEALVRFAESVSAAPVARG